MLLNTIVLFLYCASLAVQGASIQKVPCSYDDEECLTKSTRAIFPKIVAGRPGEVEPSDPLHLDLINIEVSDLKYVLSNATMSGLLQCTVKDVLVNSKETFFNYYIWCPSLKMESDYEASGQLDGVQVEGKGTSTISYGKYHIWFKGYYDRHVDDAGNLHTEITTFILELKTEGVTREYTGLSFGANKKYADIGGEENLNKLEKTIREPLMYKFMEKYVHNLNEFLKIVPIKDIHYQVINN